MTTLTKDVAVGGRSGICPGQSVLRRQRFSFQFYLPSSSAFQGKLRHFLSANFAPGDT